MFWKQKKFTKEQVICKKVNWPYDNYWIKIENIWTDKKLILNKIFFVCNKLNEKYKKENIKFFIDPSYEQWFAVSISWLYNEHGASLRIVSDNDWLKLNKSFFGSLNIKYYFSFLSYDVLHLKEKQLLIEAAVEFMNVK